MRTGEEHAAKRRLAYIENESLAPDNDDSFLFERDVDKVGPENIEFETQSQVPGIDQAPIERKDNPFREPIMGSERNASEDDGSYNVGEKLLDEKTGEIWTVKEVNGEDEWLDATCGETKGQPRTQTFTFDQADNMQRTASTREAKKDSLDLLNVKNRKVKQPFDTEENRTMVDRSPGDSLFGDDKQTQGRHITNMKGPGGLKTGMVKKAELNIGDDVLVGSSTYKVAEIKSNGIIARHAFTSSDHFFDAPQFNRIAVAAFVPGDVTVQEAEAPKLFFEGSAEAGLFPIGGDDTIPE